MYKVISYYNQDISESSLLGSALLGLCSDAPRRTEPERECGHNHRSLKAAIRCAHSLAGGYCEGLGDHCARVEDEDGNVLHTAQGGMRVSFR